MTVTVTDVAPPARPALATFGDGDREQHRGELAGAGESGGGDYRLRRAVPRDGDDRLDRRETPGHGADRPPHRADGGRRATRCRCGRPTPRAPATGRPRATFTAAANSAPAFGARRATASRWRRTADGIWHRHRATAASLGDRRGRRPHGALLHRRRATMAGNVFDIVASGVQCRRHCAQLHRQRRGLREHSRPRRAPSRSPCGRATGRTGPAPTSP